jgi:hypothetical protein
MTAGYKEWSLVCEALGAGAQTVLLRKGGIAEGQAGFTFRHPHFYLLPTLFHQQEEQVRWAPRHEPVRAEDGSWLIRYEAEIIAQAVLQDWEQVQALQPYHVWKESVVKERFNYQSSQKIHAALVRIKKVAEPLRCAETPQLQGCRSWVEDLMTIKSGTAAVPVLTDAAFAVTEGGVKEILKKVN